MQLSIQDNILFIVLIKFFNFLNKSNMNITKFCF